MWNSFDVAARRNCSMKANPILADRKSPFFALADPAVAASSGALTPEPYGTSLCGRIEPAAQRMGKCTSQSLRTGNEQTLIENTTN
jgi:hypothetical protein